MDDWRSHPPDAPLVPAAGRDGCRIVAHIDGGHVAAHGGSQPEVLYFTGKVNAFWRISDPALC